jgi:hypothetical protein
MRVFSPAAWYRACSPDIRLLWPLAGWPRLRKTPRRTRGRGCPGEAAGTAGGVIAHRSRSSCLRRPGRDSSPALRRSAPPPRRRRAAADTPRPGTLSAATRARASRTVQGLRDMARWAAVRVHRRRATAPLRISVGGQLTMRSWRTKPGARRQPGR